MFSTTGELKGGGGSETHTHTQNVRLYLNAPKLYKPILDPGLSWVRMHLIGKGGFFRQNVILQSWLQNKVGGHV